MATTPAGWYDDPFMDGQQRYWDGRRWTEGTRPAEGQTQPWSDWMLVAIVIAGVVGILAHTDQPSLLLGAGLLAALGLSLAAVLRKAS
jgi:hypothetical protein